MKRSRHSVATALALGLAWFWPTATPANALDFQAATKEAARNFQTKAGSEYMDKVAQPVGSYLGAAMDICGPEYPDTKKPALIAFVVDRDGHVTQKMASPEEPFAQCVLSHLPENISLPRPPRAGWAVVAGVENHHHEAASVTKGDGSAKDILTQYDNAIAPYVAEGRATYPAAKKRFLAGLPPGNKFLVRMRVREGNKVEELFVNVIRIKAGKITGIINGVEIVKTYKAGQQITIPESEIKDWVIQHPDGSQEGNVVGKFLNHNKR